MFKTLQTFAAILCLCICSNNIITASTAAPYDVESFLRNNNPQSLQKDLIIKSITFKGNKYISTEVLQKKIPFQIGSVLETNKSSLAINNLYNLGAFKQIEIRAREDGNVVHLTFVVEEKNLLEGTEFVGNREVSTKKINEVLDLSKLSYLDEESARNIAKLIQQLYVAEGFHQAQVSFDLKPNEQNPDKVRAIFTIDEGDRAYILRVDFQGNKKIPSRKLRKVIFTRERWLLGFGDGSGTYDEKRLEQDKYFIESFYFENSFLNTKVYKTDVKFSPDHKNINVTFYIEEGDQFIVRSITPPGDDIVSSQEATAVITMQEGKPLIRHELIESMDKIASLWKEKGYVYTDVVENIRPNDETKEIDLAFMVNPGKKLYANRITISGNRTTRDSLIRRRLDILEGDLITTSKLDSSKRAVEFLSFYEPGGVNWTIHRIADDLADLEFNVKETKTGNFSAQLSYGPSGENEQKQELQGSVLFEKGNLVGHGIDLGVAVKTGFDKARPGLRRFEVRLIDPHIFDKDISCGFYLYRRWDEYDRWNMLTVVPSVNTMGTNIRFGFGLPEIDKRIALMLDLGAETIHNNNPKVRLNQNIFLRNTDPLYQLVVDRTFQQGSLLWVGLDLVKDMRNHQVYPSKGYKITLGTKTAPSSINQTFGFFRIEAAASMYNAILNEDDLVLGNHLKICNVRELSSTKSIPYKELFHMGGPNTVRGHVWSGIGPAWKATNEPLGGRNAVQCNNEITFPLARNLGMRAHVFYDLGAAWDTPNHSINAYNASLPENQRIAFDDVITRNKFNLRHTVGFGLNLTSPIPAKIDWGFKLDRDKKTGESAHEFHLIMNYAW
ncbi:outer membrane protein assembly factor BamA [Candidatus Dependentiae bacterium]|nr:outer membrane protein assembly factor BamA [Candidatus Dependentiae bacterium]